MFWTGFRSQDKVSNLVDTGVLRPFPVRAVVDCCPANGRCNLFSVPCGPSSRSGAQCRRITSLTGGPSLDTEGHGSCVLTLKRWLHFVPLCVSLIGGHFFRDPHVDLLIWCVPAGRLGGLLLGQINCLIILCSSNVTIQQEIQGKQDTCMGYLMCTKLMCTDKFFFQYPHRRQQKSSIYAFWELLCLLNILARLTDILTEFSSISGQSVGRLVKGWP